MTRRILLTNYQMLGFSGSELDTLNIANYFLSINYEVTIFTLKYGYPLLGEIDERIKLVTSNNIGDMVKKYDIIWSHHFPLLDYLLFFQGISADYIHYVSLSSIMDLESLPEYYKSLNMISVMSEHTRDALRNENFAVDDFNLFSNYSSIKNFDYKIKKHRLKKICIISNHVPPELLEFAKKFENRTGNKVDIFGRKHVYTKITSKLLYKYDLVITIGRTVNDALSIGIPVYCYDRFGGDGFLTTENIDKAFYYAFSGKSHPIKKNSEELYDDIISNYDGCTKNIYKLKKYAFNNFCFEKMMENTIRKLKKTKKFNINKVLKNYPYLIRKAPLFYNRLNEEMGCNSTYEKNIYKAHIYFDYGFGFTEKNSIFKYYKFKNGNHFVDIRVPKNVVKIRFDFSDIKYTLVSDVRINGEKYRSLKFLNCVKMGNGAFISINDDPGFLFKNNGNTRLKINLSLKILSYEDLFVYICNSSKLYRRLRKK